MSYFTDTIRALKSDGFIAHAKEYKDIRAKYYKRGSQIKRLERALAETRGCLSDAANILEGLSYGDKIILSVVAKWRKAAGLKDEQ